MQIAETVLKAIQDRGRRALPLENVYRHLYNPDIFLRAYGRIAQNTGATTQGITKETADGMSMEKINTIIEQFRCERYLWTPVKRIYVPKKNGKRRPLGIPVWSDRLVQETVRSILEAYYEPQFSDLSHGFRVNRGCHSALRAVLRWKDIEWFIEGTPNFRRLCYIRYADDFLIGFAGPRQAAQDIKRRIKEFLQSELNLELSEEKTLITHAYLDSAQFLGYEVESIIEEHTKSQKHAANELQLSVPVKAIKEKCERYKRHGKIIPRAELINDSDYNIVSLFQIQYLGYIQYYVLAHNTHILNELRWVMEKSLLKTLAEKHKTSIRKLAKQCQKTIQTPYGPLRCLEMQVLNKKNPQIVRFGDTTLRRKKRPITGEQYRDSYIKCRHTELIDRLLTNQCEYCGSMGRVEVHHVRKLADIDKGEQTPKSQWAQEMVAHQRKTLIVCKACHRAIHAGKQNRRMSLNRLTYKYNRFTLPPSELKDSP